MGALYHYDRLQALYKALNPLIVIAGIDKKKTCKDYRVKG